MSVSDENMPAPQSSFCTDYCAEVMGMLKCEKEWTTTLIKGISCGQEWCKGVCNSPPSMTLASFEAELCKIETRPVQYKFVAHAWHVENGGEGDQSDTYYETEHGSIPSYKTGASQNFQLADTTKPRTVIHVHYDFEASPEEQQRYEKCYEAFCAKHRGPQHDGKSKKGDVIEFTPGSSALGNLLKNEFTAGNKKLGRFAKHYMVKENETCCIGILLSLPVRVIICLFPLPCPCGCALVQTVLKRNAGQQTFHFTKKLGTPKGEADAEAAPAQEVMATAVGAATE